VRSLAGFLLCGLHPGFISLWDEKDYTETKAIGKLDLNIKILLIFLAQPSWGNLGMSLKISCTSLPRPKNLMAVHARRVANCFGVNFDQATQRVSVLCLLATFRRSFCFSSGAMNLADLSDAYSDTLQYVQPNLFRNYGGKSKFGGMISTVKCHEDNLLVKQTLNEPGNKRVRPKGS